MGRLAEIDRKDKITVKRLTPRHRSMARAMVEGGLRNSDLCDLFDMSPSQVSIIVNTPLFQVELRRMEALAEHETVDTLHDLNSLKNKSVEVLAEDLHGPAGDLRHKTAIAVLDRTGHPKGAPVQEHKHLHGHLHAEVKNLDKQQLYEEVMDLVDEGE